MDIVIDKLTTIDELMRLSSKGRYELIEGVIYEMAPAGEEHGIIASNIIHLIRQFVKEHKSGVVTSSKTGYKLSSAPDTVRAPDMAFKSRKRMAEGGITKGYSSVIPDLIVEVNSPSDTYTEVTKKVELWLNSGASEVWIIDPDERSVIIYGRNEKPLIMGRDEELGGGNILAGFRCNVSEIFEV